jgi:teichoic acid transport system permease protein
MTATRRETSEEFEPVYHHYGPHRAGLPPLIPYLRELWHRRGFAIEMSRANMRGANIATFFGQAWMVLNPLLLALIYYMLVTIIRQRADPNYFAHLTLNLFLFTLLQSAVTSGTTSVVRSGRLLINTAFPRLLIPLSAIRTAFYQFLPTIPVYLIIHAIFFTTEWHPRMLLGLFFIFMTLIFATGLSALFATLQIYFRDTKNFLPYLMRVWMYLSPILWMPSMLDSLPPEFSVLVELNPMYSMLDGYTALIQLGQIPPAYVWLVAAGWALGALVAGCLIFISREREFAVRLT